MNKISVFINMNIIDIVYFVLLILSVILASIAIFNKKILLILTRNQWVELLTGSLFIGIFLGFVRGNILGLDNGYDIFILGGSFFLFWYLSTKFFSNIFTAQAPMYSNSFLNLVSLDKDNKNENSANNKCN